MVADQQALVHRVDLPVVAPAKIQMIALRMVHAVEEGPLVLGQVVVRVL